MNSYKTIRFAAALFAVAIAGAVGAQQTVPLPATQVDKAACSDFQWNADMRQAHPRLPGACQDVIVYNGVKWARLAAAFTSIDRDGKVNFDIHDKSQDNRFITDVTFDPRPGQVVYMDNTTIPFNELRATDVVNLYVPEGRYGFSAQPGVEAEELVMVAPVMPAATPDRAVASRDAQPDMLPQTASALPLLALGGLLALFGGLALTLRRFF